MLNISQIPNKLYMAERVIQTSVGSINQGIGTSVPENWRGWGGGGGGGGGDTCFLSKGETFEWGRGRKV